MELADNELKEQVELYNKLIDNVKDFNEIIGKLRDTRNYFEFSSRGVDLSFLEKIYNKFPQERILNCYGDIFFIDEYKSDHYIGYRVLWNLALSKEKYEIYEISEVDSDDEYDHTEYEINVLVEDENIDEN